MFLKYINGILAGCWVFILSICAWLLFMAFNHAPVEPKVYCCGNTPWEITGDSLKDAGFTAGKAVFQNNCASCHHPIKDAAGPRLSELCVYRSQEWMCKFLTEPMFIPKDKKAVYLRRSYGEKCMKFPQLTCEDVHAVRTYIGRFRH